MELVPGLEISGSVRLVRKLGEGGMGTVWVADHLTLNTQVAVKFMTEQLASNAGATTRFTREATAAAMIKSPHVVQIFDHGLLDGRVPYIVMELLEGENLTTFVHRRGGKLSPPVLAHVIVQTCKALSKAHAREVIHRDIKPDNIFLVDSDGEIFVKLLDFGIAKQAAENLSVTSTGAVMGTAHYMSPEQMLSSKHVDARSDLWAVGVVAYQCLTGTMPFDGETFAAIAVAVAQGQFALPFAHRGIGSAELDAWFSRALARHATDRFTSAREMADAFVAAAGTSTTLAPSLVGWGSSSGETTASSGTGPGQRLAPGAAPQTFAAVSATMHPRKTRKYTVAVATLITVLVAVAVVVKVVVFRGDQDKAEAVESHATPAAEPAVNAVHAEPTSQTRPPEKSAEAVSVTAELSSATAPPTTATAAASATSQPKKAVARHRPAAGATTPPKDKPQTAPVIPDRGF